MITTTKGSLKRTCFLFYGFILFISITVCAQNCPPDPAGNRSHYFYDDWVKANEVLNLTGKETIVDSNTLNNRIDQESNSGGGTLYIKSKAATNVIYLRDIYLRDNVSLKFDKSVIIKPLLPGSDPKITIFTMGKTINEKVRNVQITSNGGRFTVDFRDVAVNRRIAFIKLRSVKNFYVGNFNLSDNNTTFCNVELLFTQTEAEDRVNGENIPYRGIVENIRSTKNHSGYGIIQVRGGKRIFFNNLNSGGGITLRLESGIPGGIKSKRATIDEVVGRKIRVFNGSSALFLNPHRIDQGCIDVRNIIAVNSGFAANIVAGFVDRKGGEGSAENNAGVFSPDSHVSGLTASGNKKKAQLRKKLAELLPCNQAQDLINRFENNKLNPDEESALGFPIGKLRYTANCNGPGCYTVKGLRGVSPVSVKCNTLGKNRLPIDSSKEKVSIIYNTNDKIITISNANGIAKIYNLSGVAVISTKEATISTVNLTSGLYIIKVENNNAVTTKKIIL
ncbi:T9SS type A sorting domain-containing protein [Aquimarina sp. ERC-38]|uniref:T9SS type A sorting domain-containing protein n=1 Tax=Aquimarina sp. ERC-38 TaxID=2949996 RepID=UPI0022463F23|nr:T9SS type A sorting domain-containing protein [Aquimarina sp. ERC-38]UZO79425.1 T9SS type A sorting domain-containing protein [Aquimarina sp. ERC-38]